MEECREWQEQQQQKVIHKWHTGWACLIFQDCLLHQNCSSTENCLAVSQISDSQMSSGASDGRKFACNVGDLGLTPGLWTSPGEVHGKSHQYSSSVQFGHSVLFDSLQPHGMQHAKPLCSTPTPRFYSNSCSLSQWCHPTISSSVSPSPPTFNCSQHQGLYKWVSSSHQVAKVLEFHLQHQSFQWISGTDLL